MEHVPSDVLAAGRMKELAPFERIPEELIQEIFKCCLVELKNDDLLDTTRMNVAIVEKISLVCKKWHGIAVATPELWAHLTISAGYEDELRLRRSRFKPLCLTEIDYHPAFHRYLFCEASVSRWRAVSILLRGFPDKELIKLNRHFEGKLAPHLEMLSFFGEDGVEYGMDLRGFAKGVLVLLSTSRNVKYFSWANLPLYFLCPESFINWSGLSQVTTIVLKDVYGSSTADDYIRFLTMCKCAKSIHLSVSIKVKDSEDFHPVTTLRLLEELSVVNIRTRAFLPYFTLPKLKKLEMRGEDASDCDALDQCYQRSSFRLTKLDAIFGTIENIYTTSSTLKTYIKLS